MTDDFFSLKKVDESLKDLDAKLSKTFRSEKTKQNIVQHRGKSQQKKLIQKQDMENLKTIARGTNDTIKKIYKYATKNKIPNTYQEMMDMKDRLELEKTQRLEMIEAKKRIKELQKERKEEIRAERKAKIQKIKLILGKATGQKDSRHKA